MNIRDWRVTMCVAAFLRNRKQMVKVGKELSEEGAVTSGVPQGSMIGPIVFCGLLSDMHTGIDSVLSLFANDSTVYRGINGDDDRSKLQEDIDNINKWVEENEMKLNIEKSAVVKFGKKK